MPIYEYNCKECGRKFELLVTIERYADEQHCPHCASDRLKRLFSTFAAGSDKSKSSGCGCGNSKYS